MFTRDTYNDYITEEELANDIGGLLQAARIAFLRRRSGAANVANGLLTVERDFCARAFVMHVSFASRAWTGR